LDFPVPAFRDVRRQIPPVQFPLFGLSLPGKI